MTLPWWAAMSPAEATVACGDGQHRLRWENGSLTAAEHPDAESELVLAALGGEQPECVRLLRAWGAHCEDLDALMLGPRSPDDQLTIDPEDAAWPGNPPRGWAGAVPRGLPSAQPWSLLWRQVRMTFVRNLGGAPLGSAVYGPGLSPPHAPHNLLRPAWSKLSRRWPGIGPDISRELQSRAELTALLALGPAFQVRLCATVAAAWSQREAGRARPALTAALAGRFAISASAWLGISPDDVSCVIGDEPTIVVREADPQRLRARVPLCWLSRIWAPGLGVVDGQLVVEVNRVDDDVAHLVAVGEPGGERTALAVHRDHAAGSLGGFPRWTVVGERL